VSEAEHEFDGIVTASYGWDEINELEDAASELDRPRARRRSGPGVLRRRIWCAGCREEISGPYVATGAGPFHAGCAG
jgi:hypothetical protein